MNSIKFSHRYIKMPDNVTESMLLEVIDIELSEISQEFLNYDTITESGERYRLPKSGKYLLLMLFDQINCELWTTMRRSTPEKRNYYRSQIGQVFKIEVTA